MSQMEEYPLRCWFSNFDAEDSFEPGIYERLGLTPVPPDPPTLRDRHLRLNYTLLERMLQETLKPKVHPVRGQWWHPQMAG